jgi:RNA polymerase sigma-70 factor (ECF subfamily)
MFGMDQVELESRRVLRGRSVGERGWHLADGSFSTFYEEHFPTVFRAAFIKCGDRGLAEDAAQEAFAKAFQRWWRLRDKEWKTGWVVRTSMNAARTRMSDSREISAEFEGTVPEHDWDWSVDVRKAIASLPRRQQQAVVLFYLVDLPVIQVARTMHCRVGTAKALLSQARLRLRHQLEVDDD